MQRYIFGTLMEHPGNTNHVNWVLVRSNAVSSMSDFLVSHRGYIMSYGQPQDFLGHFFKQFGVVPLPSTQASSQSPFTSPSTDYTLKKFTFWPPKNGGLEDGFPFSIGWFLGSMLFFRGVLGRGSSPFTYPFRLRVFARLRNLSPPKAPLDTRRTAEVSGGKGGGNHWSIFVQWNKAPELKPNHVGSKCARVDQLPLFPYNRG